MQTTVTGIQGWYSAEYRPLQFMSCICFVLFCCFIDSWMDFYRALGIFSPVYLSQRSKSMVAMDSRSMKGSSIQPADCFVHDRRIFPKTGNSPESVMSESEKALLRADFEADLKYRELISEAESILCTMRNSVQRQVEFLKRNEQCIMRGFYMI